MDKKTRAAIETLAHHLEKLAAQHSAIADAEHDSYILGKSVAYKEAAQKLWMVLSGIAVW